MNDFGIRNPNWSKYKAFTVCLSKMRLLFSPVTLLLITCGLLLAEAQDEVVESSGWVSGDGSDEAADASSEGGIVTADDPYPELNWPRAGGAIFDPAGGMFKDNVEVLVYSLMGAGASVHYTIDGSEPTNASETFTTKVMFTGVGDYLLKACVSAPEKRDSVVVEQTYHIRGEAAAPTVNAFVLDPENPDSANTTLSTDHYLGSFEDGVMLTFYTSTPNSDIKYTFDGQDPSDDYGNITTSNGRVVLDILGNITIKVKTFPREGSGFPSAVLTYWVEVHPRPPRPAFSYRREHLFLRDMQDQYDDLASKHPTKLLYPDDLETYIGNVLNPDAGMCDDCYIDDVEQGIIKDETIKMKKHEGLMDDNSLILYPGFLLRGSCHRFIHLLNTKMREYRWEIRNGTLSLPMVPEHTDAELVSDL